MFFPTTGVNVSESWRQAKKELYGKLFDKLRDEVGGYFTSLLDDFSKHVYVDAGRWADKVASLRSHDNLDRQLSALIGKFNEDSRSYLGKLFAELNKKLSAFRDKFRSELKGIVSDQFEHFKFEDLSMELRDSKFSMDVEDVVKFSDKIRSEVLKEWFKSRTDLSRNLIFRNYPLLPRGKRIQEPKGFHGRRAGTPRRPAIGLVPRSSAWWSDLDNGKFMVVPEFSLFH